MRPLIARACCCTPTTPGQCSFNWANCPEYVKFDLPGIIATTDSTVCTPYTQEQLWDLPGPQSSIITCRGTSPFPAGWSVASSFYRVTVRDILFRKHIYSTGAVDYISVPTAEQTATMYVTSSSDRHGTFAGYQFGGPAPMVIDTAYGDVAIPLNGTHPSSVGSVFSGLLRVNTGNDLYGIPGFCHVELEVEVTGRRSGGLTGFVFPKTIDRTYNGCLDNGYSYVADLGGNFGYRQKWDPIAQNDFWPCPGDLSLPEILPGEGSYLGAAPATGTVTTINNDCNSQTLGCGGDGCLIDAYNCIYTGRYQGLGFATNFRGSDTP